MERLRRGDLKSFRWVYDRHHEKVYGYCCRLLSSRVVAEEITEDVFVRLWEKPDRIDPDYGISGLLLKMTKDFVWNYLKKEYRRKEQVQQYIARRPGPSTPAIESDLIFQDYVAIAEAAIRKLPEKRRVVFNLRYKAGLDNREIARQLDISEATVRVHLLKATRFLKGYLKSHPEIPLFFFLQIWALS